MEPQHSWADSPFIGMCIRPRETIRAIVDRNPREGVILLVAGGSFVIAMLSWAASPNPGVFKIGGETIPLLDPHTMRLAAFAGMFVWPALAVVFLYINGAYFQWLGGLLGGTATAVEVRAALAWSYVPVVAMNLVTAPIALFTGMPAHAPQTAAETMAYAQSLVPLALVTIPLEIWCVVVWLKAFGEVHRFSTLRALGASLIGLALAAAGLIVIAVAAAAIFGTMLK
ncbi:MAG: Yip1 family protein [Candidatus Binataceae bacterium]